MTSDRGGIDDRELRQVQNVARPLAEPGDLDGLIQRIGDARYVLLGEASHGTAEYYRWRAEITRRLLAEKGFSFVAVEGDWPDCARLDRWVKDTADGTGAREALAGFVRWPRWMWANEEVAEFLEWLGEHNRGRPEQQRAGFFGLDVYSLWESLEAVMGYLREHHPDALADAARAWQCFQPYGQDPQQYAWATRLVPSSCEDEVVRLLTGLRRPVPVHGDGPSARFDAEQNALVAVHAERYYRAMVRTDEQSWNIRDTFMADTLDRLMRHHGDGSRAVVWAHNTHVGDARATSMARAGLVNLGQLVRERHAGDGVVLVGFGGYRGSVIAGESWGAPARRMPVPPAREDTVESLLHRALGQPSVLVFGQARARWLRTATDHRAIGVVYDPTRERAGNYVPTVLGQRYNAFCSFDQTEALHPLEPARTGAGAESETYPTAQ